MDYKLLFCTYFYIINFSLPLKNHDEVHFSLSLQLSCLEKLFIFKSDTKENNYHHSHILYASNYFCLYVSVHNMVV